MNKVYNLLQQLAEVKESLTGLIDTLPDCAEGVNLLSGSKTCGVVSLSTISKNKGILSPSYYITSEIKNELKERIRKGTAESIGSLIEEILNSGKIIIGGQTNKLPSNFLTGLKKIWKDF